jgi:hypothetical protein
MKATLENLLCIIHRDGGQYISEHGIEKAFADALEIHYAQRDTYESIMKKYDTAEILKGFKKATDNLKEKGITKENGLGYGY